MSMNKTIVKSAKRWFGDVDQKKARAQMRSKYGDGWHAELGFSNLSTLKQHELFTKSATPCRLIGKVRVGRCLAPARVVEKCEKKGKMIPVSLEFEAKVMCYCGARSSDQGEWCSDSCGGCKLTANGDAEMCDFLHDGNKLCGHHHRLSTLG